MNEIKSDLTGYSQRLNRVRSGIFAGLILLGLVVAGEEPSSYPQILGTQSFGVSYSFTDQTKLVETARAMDAMGSRILKVSLGKDCLKQYGISLPADVQSLRDLATLEPSFSEVLHMPFKTTFLWVYSHNAGWFGDGFSDDEKEREYREVYDLASWLLTEFAGKPREFYLGHWEGDWHIHPGYAGSEDPDPVAVEGMIRWLNIRQEAIDDAKRDHPGTGVKLYHYTEVNLVEKSRLGGKCLVNAVLPKTTVDLVSYSSYEAIGAGEKDRERLKRALDLIESYLPPKSGIAGKRVFIGEYGFPVNRDDIGTPANQLRLTRKVAAAAIEWGCPFVLYWAIYCNEIFDGEPSRHRGFWMIDDKGEKQPVYHFHRAYFEAADRWHAEHPGADESDFRKWAVEWIRDYESP